MFGGRFRYFSFEEPLVRQRAQEDPEDLLDAAGEPLIIDEVQYVPEITTYLKMRIDVQRAKRGRFILTGSQQFHLIKNLGDSLSGRIALFTLLPFNIRETAAIPDRREKGARAVFIAACLRGSFPEISIHKKINVNSWYNGYLQTYLERDIRNIHAVDNLRDFQKFMQLLAARCAQVLNLSALSQDLGVTVNTLKRWISLLEATQIIYLLPPYYNNLGKRITKNPKVYFLDCGLVAFLVGIRDAAHLLQGPMAGAIFENYIIQETVKAYFNHGLRPRIYYLRTQNELEVDLIIEKSLQLFPCEIKLSQSPNTAMAQPLERFRRVFGKLDIGPAKIVCLSDKATFLTRSVSVLPLADFPDWLKDKL
ncbi:MAG: ATP-binding protein [Candidatus Omnitrophica bacterium]|nr:ATP-binding protein [Candidatus Omnitrophota bacterium]